MDLNSKWNNLRKILERNGPFCHSEFEANSETLAFVRETCKTLVIGAGGLGCELLKNLALMGFTDIHVIDMDVIDLSNLNRQFLFRSKDIGKPKAEVAAKFINGRIPGVRVTSHFNKIQDFPEDFYRQFNVVVCGLDSIVARRWINGMILSLLNYEDGVLDTSTVIPFVDGGTEGFKGNARVIIPGITACIECVLDLFPPQVNYPLCTIANTPRLPEHCIEYVRIFQWSKENPFGGDIPIDGDDHAHVQWIYEKSMERSQEYNIDGVTYRLTQGVVKHIMPAVASTNAIIASACATEVFKLATSCCANMNYMVFNDVEGIYTYTYEAEKNDTCLACSTVPQVLKFNPSTTLGEVIDLLSNSGQYQMKSPGITTTIDGKNKTLYMQSIPSIEERTRSNKKLSLKDLQLKHGQELVVADVTSPNSLIFVLNFEDPLL